MNKKITALLLVVLILVLAWAYYINAGVDRTPPVITVSGEMMYTEGEPQSKLLEGVTAYDEVDGDVTDSVIVEKTHLTSAGELTVYYAAKDSHNNVTRIQRNALYIAKDGNDVDKKYKIALINNLGITNLATVWGNKIAADGHTIISIGLSSHPAQDNTVIYVKNEGEGKELLEYFNNAIIAVGDISNTVNVNAKDADVFIVLGKNDIIL